MTGRGNFAPDSFLTRSQGLAIIVRWVASQNGYDLAAQTEAEGDAILAALPDGHQISLCFAMRWHLPWTSVSSIPLL